MNSAIMIAVLVTSLGQAEPDASESTEKARLERARQQMQNRWSAVRAFLRIDDQEKEVDRREKPIWSYSEPARDGGQIGSLWVWGTKGRPVAMYAQTNTPGTSTWRNELVAMSKGVSAVMHDDWKWVPDSALRMTALKAPPPAAGRDVPPLTQMTALVRRISISELHRGIPSALRQTPRNIYRYQDKESGLIDGALFNFARGRIPKAIAVIECRRSESGSELFFGFLPLSGAAMTGKLNYKTVWSKEATNSSKAQESYSVWLETVND